MTEACYQYSIGLEWGTSLDQETGLLVFLWIAKQSKSYKAGESFLFSQALLGNHVSQTQAG